MDVDSPKGLILRQVRQLQCRRVSLYKQWESHFREYIAGELSFEEYSATLQFITRGFSETSKGVIGAEEQLKGIGETSVAAMVRHLQELERSKLKKTTEYQAKREAFSKLEDDHENFHVQDRVWREANNLVKTIEKEIQEHCETLRFIEFGMD